MIALSVTHAHTKTENIVLRWCDLPNFFVCFYKNEKEKTQNERLYIVKFKNRIKKRELHTKLYDVIPEAWNHDFILLQIYLNGGLSFNRVFNNDDDNNNIECGDLKHANVLYTN